MIGFDTGFFFKLLKGDRKAVEIFEKVDDDTDLCVSSLTIFELTKLSLKGALEQQTADRLIENIMVLGHIIWLDSVDLVKSAAGLSHGLGIPAVDSLILAGFVANKTNIIYTTDSHFEKYVKKGVKVVKL